MAAMLAECDGGSWVSDFLADVGDAIDEDLLNGYDLYVQPGGESPWSGTDAFEWNEISAIQKWVESGGRYYGSCWGGYAVGDWVFLFLNTAFVQELYLNFEVPNYDDTKVTITWFNGTDFEVYFQDGPTWLLNANQEDLVTRLADYKATGNIAAMVFPYGDGKVGASGVHFEGRSNDIGFYNPAFPRQYGLGCSLLDKIMNNGASSHVPTELPIMVSPSPVAADPSYVPRTNLTKSPFVVDPVSPSPSQVSTDPSSVPHTDPTEPTDPSFMVDPIAFPPVATDPNPAPSPTPKPGSSESELAAPASAAQHVSVGASTTVLCAASSYLLWLLGFVRII